MSEHCDHQPRESWVLKLNQHREEVMHCHKCGKYKAHYKAVEKKSKRIIETTSPVNRQLLIGHDGIGD